MRPAPLSTVDAVQTERADPTPAAPVEPSPTRRRRRAPASGRLSPEGTALVYVGVALVTIGFAILAFTWSRVAGTAIVALQLPYLISGGFSGLGLVVVGLVIIHLAARRRDAWRRDRRLQELAAVIEAIAAREEPDESLTARPDDLSS